MQFLSSTHEDLCSGLSDFKMIVTELWAPPAV